MGNTRVRGQEATIRITTVSAGGIVIPLGGSFFKVSDFTWNPNGEITEDGFLGEVADDLDHQNHGFGGSFSIGKVDSAASIYTRQLVAASLASIAPPITTILVVTKFRSPSEPSEKLNFAEGIMMMASESVAGRKDFINNAFEWKSKFLL